MQGWGSPIFVPIIDAVVAKRMTTLRACLDRSRPQSSFSVGTTATKGRAYVRRARKAAPGRVGRCSTPRSRLPALPPPALWPYMRRCGGGLRRPLPTPAARLPSLPQPPSGSHPSLSWLLQPAPRCRPLVGRDSRLCLGHPAVAAVGHKTKTCRMAETRESSQAGPALLLEVRMRPLIMSRRCAASNRACTGS